MCRMVGGGVKGGYAYPLPLPLPMCRATASLLVLGRAEASALLLSGLVLSCSGLVSVSHGIGSLDEAMAPLGAGVVGMVEAAAVRAAIPRSMSSVFC